MRLFVGTDKDENGQIISQWFSSRVGKTQHGPFAALGWVNGDQICSAALFNDYTGANVEAHIVGRMTRQTIKEAFAYCFNQLGVLRLTAKPQRSNRKLLKILPRMGFAYEATLRNYYGPDRADDALVFRLDQTNALKWMR